MMTREIMDKMTNKEFDDYLKERAEVKPYLDRYTRECIYGGFDTTNFEEWLKETLRDERLNDLLNG